MTYPKRSLLGKPTNYEKKKRNKLESFQYYKVKKEAFMLSNI